MSAIAERLGVRQMDVLQAIQAQHPKPWLADAPWPPMSSYEHRLVVESLERRGLVAQTHRGLYCLVDCGGTTDV